MTEQLDDAFKPPSRSDVPTSLEPLLAELRGYRATYFSVVEKARDKLFDPSVAIRTIAKFDALEDELLAAQTDQARRNIVDRAEELEQSRAYIQPESELAVEANTLVADMTDWGVPAQVLDAIDRDLISVIRSKDKSDKPRFTLDDKRAALNKLYQYYDAWSDHVENYERWATRTAWGLGVLLIGSSVGCVVAIAHHAPLYGFMLAGLTGALLSVLGKFPPMLGWGQWASYTPRMLGRITTGIATTFAGGALLALDVIRFGETKFLDYFKQPDPTTQHLLILIGLGVVFGFSERALVQFQEIVFQKQSKQGDSEDKS